MLQFGLIGRSLTHSFSEAYFTSKFRDLECNASYKNFECEDVESIKALLKTTDASGFNVTIPYKESIIPLLDHVDSVAIEVGAVNVISNEKGKWVGYNTDVFGFKQMIKPFFESHHERAVILGTGGASKAVQFVLEHLGCKVVFVSRVPDEDDQFGYQDMNAVMLNSCPIIVNATPVGMFPNEKDLVNIPYAYLTERHLVIDLIYNPKETEFIKLAKQHGATTINGLTMLHQQAEKAWEIWQSK